MTLKSDKWSTSKFPETCKLLELYGINPATMLNTDINIDGYTSVILDANGKRVSHIDPKTGENMILTGHIEWATEAIGLEILTKFIQEGGYRKK